MTVLITLTLAGSDVGPFDLYSDLDGYTTPFETGVSRAALIAGYTSTLVPDGSGEVLAQSTGACIRDLYMPIEGAPTTTTTSTSSTSTTSTTTTPAPDPYYYYEIQRYDCALGCEPGTTAIGRATNALDIGYFYHPPLDSFVYEILSATTGSYYNVDLYGSPSRATCSEACSA